MRRLSVTCPALASLASASHGQAPHLRKQLIVDGKPFLLLSGELGNNTATSLENMRLVWSRLAAGNLNCVLAAVSWAQIEPEEGKYEFASGDRHALAGSLSAVLR